MATDGGEVTALLKAWGAGDAKALERLTPRVFDELRLIARRYMRNERDGHTLQATALVNEVYLRLVDVKDVDWQQRAQFFGLAASMMRRILVDAARARGSHKRGGGIAKANIDEVAVTGDTDDAVVAVDEALEDFAKVAPRQAKVVELRYFAGLGTEEIAVIMNTSPRTVDRDWQFARSWLMTQLRG